MIKFSEKGFTYVSVIIPMRNEEKYIDKCINSLINQDYSNNLYEILVIDGKSDDNSKKVVQSLSNENPNLLLFENPNLFTSFGLNIGIRKSKGEIIIILGAHSFVESDFIRKNVETLAKVDADCVGGPIESLGETYTARVISLAMASPFGVGNALFRYSKKEGYADTVAFGAYKREVFKKIGLFDEELIKNQDDEFNYRLRKSGGKIFLSPHIRSYYKNRSTFIKLWKQYFQYGFWKIRVLQKHPKTMKLRHFVPAIFISSILFISALTLFHNSFFYMLLLTLFSYAVSSIIFAVIKAANKKIIYLPLLPLAFAILHFSYGIGFLVGIVNFLPKWFDR